MASVLEKLGEWRPFTALVVGDFMLDQLVYGDAERLSPDAPVPVLQVQRTESTPGGAANVCLDLVALQGRVIAFGVTGVDHEGAEMRMQLENAGVRIDGLIADPSRPTTVKRSLVGLAQHRHPQKMFRLDMESRTPLAEEARDNLTARFKEALSEADVVCIEDYAKGVCCERVCQAVIKLCAEAGKPVLVDPAAIKDYARYRGATAITPNRSEAELATGMRTGDGAPEACERLARQLQHDLDTEAIVLTLDKQGAMLYQRDGAEGELVPTIARDVYDVTGAGDMVLAAIAAAQANALTWRESVEMANAAAGLEVEVFGVKPIPLERIRHALLVEGRKLRGKVRTLEEAAIEVAAHREDGKRVVFTNGCFDVLHAGHISLLRKAAGLGDVVVLGVNSDASVRRLKGDDRPVHDQGDRGDVLSELESIDVIIFFDEDTPLALIEALRPDVLVKGADYAREDVIGGDLVESYGGRVELVELLQGRSTTGAINRIRAGGDLKTRSPGSVRT